MLNNMCIGNNWTNIFLKSSAYPKHSKPAMCYGELRAFSLSQSTWHEKNAAASPHTNFYLEHFCSDLGCLFFIIQFPVQMSLAERRLP